MRWRVPRDQVPTVREEARFDGVVTGDPNSAKDTKGLPLIYLFVGAVLVPYLADALLAVYRDAKYGGMVVVSKGDELVIENDPRLEGGVIVVKDAKGVTIYRSKTVSDPNELIAALTKVKS